MHGFKGERVLMRIHVGEQDKFEGKPLYQQIVELLRKKKYAGCTAFRGIMSFGIELSLDLPVVIECVETEDRIKAILPELDNMIDGGLITLERARVIMYRPHRPEDEEADDWSLDVTGSWQTTRPNEKQQ